MGIMMEPQQYHPICATYLWTWQNAL